MFQAQALLESAVTDSPIPRDYYARKVAGLCTRCGAPAAEDSQLCEEHRQEARRLRRESDGRVRADRRDRGLCAYCGRVKSETYACAGCRIRRGDAPTSNADNAADNLTTPSPISNKGARRGAGIWRVGTTDTDDGTIRYRGQGARGQVPLAVLDERDCKQIADALERGRRGLAYANSDEVRALPAVQRREAAQAALSLIALAGRFLDELLERRRYKP